VWASKCGMTTETHSDDVAETDDVPKVDTTSEKYALGFDAGPEGKRSDGETREWRRGWADAAINLSLQSGRLVAEETE
jgi:hypothetical protein